MDKLLDIWNNGDCAVLLDWRIPFETTYQMMLEAGIQKCFIESRLLKDISLLEYSDVSFTPFELADRRPHLLPYSIRSKYHAKMLTEEYEKRPYELSSLKTIYCSGEILNDKVYANAHKVLDGIEIFNVYGLSEAGPRVTAQTKDCCKSNSVGKPINGVNMAIVNEKGCLVKRGERGVVHVNTPSRYCGICVRRSRKT